MTQERAVLDTIVPSTTPRADAVLAVAEGIPE